jgi:hypothetical protein
LSVRAHPGKASACASQPLADQLDRKLCRVTGNAGIHPTNIDGYIAGATRHDLVERFVLKVVSVAALRVAFRADSRAVVFTVADLLLLLGIARAAGWPMSVPCKVSTLPPIDPILNGTIRPVAPQAH